MAEVYLLSEAASWLQRAIPLGRDVTCVHGVPNLSSRAKSGDVVVLDLEHPHGAATPALISRIIERCPVLVVCAHRAVSPMWLPFIAQGRAELLTGSEESLLGRLRDRLAALVGRPDAKALAYGVLAANSRWLGTLEHYVLLLCADPWRIRRPSDLALGAGVSLDTLRRECRISGHRRIEHFITEVRTALRDVLIRFHGIPAVRASAFAGIGDGSNHRRQLLRARSLLQVVAMIVLSCAVEGCGGPPQADAAPPDSARETSPVMLAVVGAAVGRSDLVLTVRATGRVRAERLVQLRSENQGTVTEVLVTPGEEIAARQPIARLDPRPFDLAVREAEGELADARFRFRDLLIGDDPNDSSEVASTRRENARQSSGVLVAEARLERAQLERERAVFTAPFGGVIDEISVVPGQRVGAGDFIARIVDMSSLVVEASVLEHDLALLRPGGQATVTANAGDNRRVPGRIAAVLPLIDSTTRAGRVLVRLPSVGTLRPGMHADVELESGRLSDRVVVPAQAVIERDGRPLVFRVRGGKAEWVYVQPGRSNGRLTEIRPDSASTQAPVMPGDTVLVEGHLTLTHDAPVRVTSLIRL